VLKLFKKILKLLRKILKSCVNAQMNRLSAPLWAYVECCIVRDTTFIRKEKSKIEEKITNFNEFRELIVWLPKRTTCDTSALYEENSFVYGTTSESVQHRCQRNPRKPLVPFVSSPLSPLECTCHGELSIKRLYKCIMDFKIKHFQSQL